MQIRDAARWSIASDAFVFFATLLIHGLAASVGAIFDADAPLYATLADGVLRGDWSGVFNPARLLWTKTIFIAIAAGAKAVAPVQWLNVLVALNVVCSAATAVLLVSVIRRATAGLWAAWAAFVLYAGAFDVFHGNRYPMTDPLYMLFATAVFVLVARPILSGEVLRSLVPLVACILLACFTRPPGAVLIVVVLLGALLFWPRRDGREHPARRRRWLWLALSGILLAGVAVRTYIVQDPSRWPSAFLRPKVVQFAHRERGGEVVVGQAATFRTPPVTIGDHLVLQGDRFVRFFQFHSPAFSRRHNVVNALYFIPLYVLGIVGIIDAIRTADRRRRDFILLLLLWIAVFAWYHAITTLLWRYRTPLMPQFIALAACGVDALMRGRRTGTMDSR